MKNILLRATKSGYEVVEQFVESGVEFEKNFELSLTLKSGNSGILEVQKVVKGDDLKNILQLQKFILIQINGVLEKMLR